MHGIVYLIESVRDYDVVYKIGYTRKSSKNRSKQLQTGNDGELKIIHQFNTQNKLFLEKTLHNLFSHKKIKNEWFKLDLEDVVNFPELCNKIENNLNIINKEII
jgi:hypothetical protein